jgi:hypothetical protein
VQAHDAASLGEYFLTFWTAILPSTFCMALPKHEGTTILQNITNYLPSDRASHPRRLQSSTAAPATNANTQYFSTSMYGN